MLTVCELNGDTPIYRSIHKSKEGDIIRQDANSCIDLPVRLWTLYNHAFFCAKNWNPRLVVLNANLDTPTYQMCRKAPAFRHGDIRHTLFPIPSSVRISACSI